MLILKLGSEILILWILYILYMGILVYRKGPLGGIFFYPKDIQAAAKEHPERFPGQHVLGWKLAILCLILAIGTFVYGGWDGIKNGFSFWQFFVRFLVMLYLWKAFDIVCLDWLLLTKSHFFQHFYPETEGCAGYHSFGFNRKGQIIRIIVFPFVAAALAGMCLLFG